MDIGGGGSSIGDGVDLVGRSYMCDVVLFMRLLAILGNSLRSGGIQLSTAGITSVADRSASQSTRKAEGPWSASLCKRRRVCFECSYA